MSSNQVVSIQDNEDLEKINDTICLSHENTYQFIITDSFGDGLCCLEGDGQYVLSANEIPLVEGGNFGLKDEFKFRFKNCTIDEECDDSDVSTVDVCHSRAKTCIHHFRPCDLYGVTVHVEITTDDMPNELSWTLKGNNDGKLKLKGGPYELAQLTYSDEVCLIDGVYNFTLYDAGEDSFSRNQIHYKLYNDRVVLAESESMDGVKTSFLTKSFKIIKESQSPSTSPSNTPSMLPTGAPSKSSFPSKSNKPTRLEDRYPRLLYDGRKCKSMIWLGKTDDVDSCISQAKNDANCAGTEVTYHHIDKRCYCCIAHPTCPGDASRYWNYYYYQVYQYKPCLSNVPSNPTFLSTEMLHSEKYCWYRLSLGYADSIDLCAYSAINTPGCTGNELYYSSNDKSCFCCYAHPTCPGDSSRYGSSSFYDVYQYKSCPTTIPSSSIMPSDTTFPSSTPSTSIMPSELPSTFPSSTPSKAVHLVLLHSGKYCRNYIIIGYKDDVESCAIAAMEDSSCTGNELSYSSSYKSCFCCYAHPTCPGDSSRYISHSGFNVYQYKDCPSNEPSHQPSNVQNLSDNPSNSPEILSDTSSNNPSLNPTKLLSNLPLEKLTNSPSSYPSIKKSNIPSYDPSSLRSSVPSKLRSNSPSIKLSDSPSSNPSSPPSKSSICNSKQMNFYLSIQTDWKSKYQNRIMIHKKTTTGWKLVKKLPKLPNNSIFDYSMCLKKWACYRMRITDRNGDGICCQNGEGSYEIFWGGESLLLFHFYNTCNN